MNLTKKLSPMLWLRATTPDAYGPVLMPPALAIRPSGMGDDLFV
jgi:hypothetical protein